MDGSWLGPGMQMAGRHGLCVAGASGGALSVGRVFADFFAGGDLRLRVFDGLCSFLALT